MKQPTQAVLPDLPAAVELPPDGTERTGLLQLVLVPALQIVEILKRGEGQLRLGQDASLVLDLETGDHFQERGRVIDLKEMR